jgi:hypothetical protein
MPAKVITIPNEMRFTAPLDVRQVGSDKWMTLRAFSFYVTHDHKEVITVPNGFITDFASVPPVARWLIPKSGRHNQAAVLHDFLYQNLRNKWKDWDGKKYTRKECDEHFLEAMRILGVNWLKRYTMYRAVRRFGGLHMALTK